ncbi:winged helix-turn-helix domain-containing protein [bacterium]|nr:winged helix-turn-helix domain-containing protein [bacterium]
MRWQVLWLVTRPAQPLSATAAAKSVGFTPAWGRAILKRYNGSDPLLSTEQRAELFAALQAEPPDGGLWSGPKVAAFVKDRFGVEVWPRTGWQWLKNLGFRLVVPRPRHPKATTPALQRVWLRPARRAVGGPAPAVPGQGCRVVVRGRGPVGVQADRPAGVGVEGHPAPEQRAAQVRVGVRVRGRTPQERAEPVLAPPEGQRRVHGPSAGRLRGVGRPGRAEGAGGDRGRFGRSRGQEAGGAAQRGAPPSAQLHPRVATGRAPVAPGARGRGQPGVRHAPEIDRRADHAVPVARRSTDRCCRCRRVPPGRPGLTVAHQ